MSNKNKICKKAKDKFRGLSKFNITTITDSSEMAEYFFKNFAEMMDDCSYVAPKKPITGNGYFVDMVKYYHDDMRNSKHFWVFVGSLFLHLGMEMRVFPAEQGVYVFSHMEEDEFHSAAREVLLGANRLFLFDSSSLNGNGMKR